MEPERPLDRGEVAAMLFNIADLNTNVAKILYLIEDYLDGEEEVPEDDS